MQIGRANDPAETAADRFAAELGRDLSIASTAVLRRQTATADDPLGGTTADASVSSRIRSARGGIELPADVRAAAEARSGRDLSGVRVHTGAEPARLSRSLQATAFTAGTNIFLGEAAGRPGTAAGNTLLGHELGHVVQQGGGIVSRRIQRREDLRALAPRGAGTVQRLFGIGGKNKTGSSAAQKHTAKEAAEAQMMLRRRITAHEMTLVKLNKRAGNRTADDYSVAYTLRAAAEKELFALTGGAGANGKVAGAKNNDDRKRLQRVVEEAQLIFDEHRVAQTKKRAGEIYHQAGQQGQRGATGGGFENLKTGEVQFDAPGSQSTDVDQLTNESPAQIAVRLEAAGAALGLSKAEVAAIATFTDEDYKYINPATANSMDWMKAANKAITDERKLGSMRTEGALHAGMAVQGLLKMPVWKGTTYRGEKMKKEDVDAHFSTLPNGKMRVLKKTFSRQALSSTSKELARATSFQFIGSTPPGGSFVVWETQLINGRDIEELSVNKHEKEVATLPGAEFEIISAMRDSKGVIRAQVRQTK